jgi:Flp pilus assembly pilin Flp
MSRLLYNFYKEEDGQDLIEYSLLITFIAITCAVLVGSGTPAIRGIWTTSNTRLVDANAHAAQ